MLLKQTVQSGFIFAVFSLLFTVPFAGVALGALLSGAIGVGFGLSLLMAAFLVTKPLSSIKQESLLPDETIVERELGNLVFTPADQGFKRLVLDKYFWVFGFKNKESSAGSIYLTNFRIIFKSHGLNRLDGFFSIPLPSIKHVRMSSFGISKKMILETEDRDIEFVVDDKLAAKISSLTQKLTEPDVRTIQESVVSSPEKWISTLSKNRGIDKLNDLFLLLDKGGEIKEIVLNPLEALGTTLLQEVVDKSFVDKWQKKLNE